MDKNLLKLLGKRMPIFNAAIDVMPINNKGYRLDHIMGTPPVRLFNWGKGVRVDVRGIPFDPFHDHLTSLVLRDGGVRNAVYKLIFDELAAPKKERVGVMQRYVAGPLFNAVVWPGKWRIPTNRTPQCFVARRLRDIAPMPNFGHSKGMDVRVVDGPKHDVVIFNQPTSKRLAVTVEGRRRQKLLEGITHTADGRPIDDNGRVPEDDLVVVFSKGDIPSGYFDIQRDKERPDSDKAIPFDILNPFTTWGK